MQKEKKMIIRKAVIVISVLGLLLLAVFLFIEGRSAPTQALKVEEKLYAEKIIAVGQLGLEQETTLVAEVNGKIQSIFLEEGESIREGALLLEIENQVTSEYGSATSEYSRMNSLLSAAQADYNNAQTLFEEGAISQSELISKKNSYESVLSQRKAAQLKVEIAADNASKYKVKSPWEAVLLKSYVAVGDYVTIGEPLADIGSVGGYQILAELDEKYFPVVKKGMSVLISVGEGTLGETRAEISSITPQIDPNTGTFQIRIQIPEEFPYQASNLTVNLEILLLEKDRAIVIPEKYLLAEKGTSKSEGFVLLYVNGTAKKQSISIDSGFGSNFLVSAGLKDGDLLLSPEGGLKDGDRVKRYEEGESN